jgi:hypothetical protein
MTSVITANGCTNCRRCSTCAAAARSTCTTRSCPRRRRCGPTRQAPARRAGAPGMPEAVHVLAPCDMVLHSAVHLFYPTANSTTGCATCSTCTACCSQFGATAGFLGGAAGAGAGARTGAAAVLRAALHAPARHAGAGGVLARSPAGRRPPAPLLALMDALFRAPAAGRMPAAPTARAAAHAFLVHPRQLAAHAAADAVAPPVPQSLHFAESGAGPLTGGYKNRCVGPFLQGDGRVW